MAVQAGVDAALAAFQSGEIDGVSEVRGQQFDALTALRNFIAETANTATIIDAW